MSPTVPVATQAPAKDASPVTVVAVAMTLAAASVLLFYFAAYNYFANRYGGAAGIEALSATTSAKQAALERLPSFAVFAVLVAGLSSAALLAPRKLLLGLLPMLAIVNLVAGIMAIFGHQLPGDFVVAQIIIGVLFAVFGVFYLVYQSRAAWAALSAMSGVLAVVLLFGSTKLAAMFGISVWFAMVPVAVYFGSALALRHASPSDNVASQPA